MEHSSAKGPAASQTVGRPPLSLGANERGTDDRIHLLYTSKQIRDVDHLKVFANVDAAETWFEENDPEGIAFEYEVLE